VCKFDIGQICAYTQFLFDIRSCKTLVVVMDRGSMGSRESIDPPLFGVGGQGMMLDPPLFPVTDQVYCCITGVGLHSAKIL